MEKVAVITFYKFLPLDKLEMLREELLATFADMEVKGLLLLAKEGLNGTLSVHRSRELELKQFIQSKRSDFSDLLFKVSYCEDYPFKKLVVKIKAEAVTMRKDGIAPDREPAPYIKPSELKNWYDEGKDFLIVDTRNDFEYKVGTFKNAKNLKIKNFVDYPETAAKELAQAKDKTIVTFCTGGIRCEKAAPQMLKMGFKNVYQLEGGILNYFQECGGENWEGDCFVFDHRVAVGPDLKESDVSLCTNCQNAMPDKRYKELKMNERFCPDCEDSIPAHLAKKINEFKIENQL